MNKQQSELLGPLILIKDIPEKGLRIFWNLKGIMLANDYQTYHIFVIIGTKLKPSYQFLKLYYKNLSLGDLLGVYKNNPNEGSKLKLKWTQKTAFQFNDTFLKDYHIFQNFTCNSFEQLLKAIQKLNGLVLINIFFQQLNTSLKKDLIQIRKKMNILRQTKSDTQKVVFNFISDSYIQSSVNSVEGENYFAYNETSPLQTILDMKKYLKILVLKKLKVRILIKNHLNYNLIGETNWKVSDEASYIQKTYYSVPACSFEQYIIFLTMEYKQEINMNLVVQLQLSFYNGKKIKATKNVTFKTNSTYHKSKTTYIQNDKPYEFANIFHNQTSSSNNQPNLCYLCIF